jgi:hypothetical protein
MQQAVIDRLVEMTFAPAQDVARWLKTLGFEVEPQEDSVFIVRNGTFTTAISEHIDPINRAVCLAWVIAGMFWPHIFPGLLEAVNKEWRKRRQQARGYPPQSKPKKKRKEV